MPRSDIFGFSFSFLFLMLITRIIITFVCILGKFMGQITTTYKSDVPNKYVDIYV